MARSRPRGLPPDLPLDPQGLLSAKSDSAAGSGQRIGAWVTIALLAIVYAPIGRRVLSGDSRFGLSFFLALIIGSGVLVACSPNLTLVQAIAFPVHWRVIPATRVGAAANIALVVSTGFVVSVRTGTDKLSQTALIQSIALVNGALAESSVPNGGTSLLVSLPIGVRA